METPFYDKMAAISRRGPRFFVPGHKGNAAAIAAFGGLLAWDLTEVEGAGDLTCPDTELAQSQANMARAYGAGATLYSASGSTSCIGAMLALFVGGSAGPQGGPAHSGPAAQGGKIVMARGAHVAALRAMALLGITPAWVPLRGGRPQPGDIAAALDASGAGAVYLTSPDYYGRMADIAGIAAVCRAHGAALLVDNAHGAYLKFMPGAGGGAFCCGARQASPKAKLPNPTQPEPAAMPHGEGWPRSGRGGADLHPLTLGADATADSAHKTLPCLTPAAMLHLRDPSLAGAARQALNLFCSTSPSYLVLESLDLAAGLLLESPPDFAGAARRLKGAGEGFAQITAPCDDPLRLVLRPALAGLEPAPFAEALLEKGIAPEYFDGDALVLMASPWNTEADFAALHKALQQLSQSNPLKKSQKNQIYPFFADDSAPLPEAVLSIREAFFAPHETIPTEQAAGRVCGSLHAPCPPGVPLAAPGERLSREICARLAAGGIFHLDVVK